MKKKVLGVFLATLLASTSLFGCGNSDEAGSSTSDSSTVTSNSSDNAVASTSEMSSETATSASASALSDDEEVNLHIYGPGIFATAGEDGSLDLISGIELPGYNKLLKRWNELHPNVHVQIEAIPWDNWQSAVQTAVLSGDIDIITQGASLTDLAEPLGDYLKADPTVSDSIYNYSSRITDKYGDMTTPVISGIPVQLNPMIAMIDTKIFEDYGVELPSDNWTWEDLYNMASKMTGTDPVTGKQTYGVQINSMESVGNRYFTYMLLSAAYDNTCITYGKAAKDCKIDYTNEKSIKAFQMLKNLLQLCSSDVKEGVNVSTVLSDENDTAIRYDQGAVSHYFEAKSCEEPGRFKFITLPVVEEGEYKGKPSPFVGDTNMAICNTSKNKEWAWEFIKFMVSDKEAIQWIVDTHNIPNNKDAVTSLAKITDTDFADTVNREMESLPPGWNTATNSYYNSVSFGTTYNTFGNIIGELAQNNITAEEAAKELQDSIDEYMTSIK